MGVVGQTASWILVVLLTVGIVVIGLQVGCTMVGLLMVGIGGWSQGAGGNGSSSGDSRFNTVSTPGGGVEAVMTQQWTVLHLAFGGKS